MRGGVASRGNREETFHESQGNCDPGHSFPEQHRSAGAVCREHGRRQFKGEPRPAASKTTTGESMDGSTTGERGTTMKNRAGNGMKSGTTGMNRESSAPSSSGNVGPGTNNNSGPQPGGR